MKKVKMRFKPLTSHEIQDQQYRAAMFLSDNDRNKDIQKPLRNIIEIIKNIISWRK